MKFSVLILCVFFFLSEEIILVLMSEKLLLFYILSLFNKQCLYNMVYNEQQRMYLGTHDVLNVVIKMIHKEIVLSVEVISC